MLTVPEAAAASPPEQRTRPRLPMLWITWRQHGAAVAGGLGLLGCGAAAMIISVPRLRHAAAAIGPRYWPATARSFYSPHYPDIVMQAIPLLIGLLAGVPLAGRDIENRTTGFAWTQGTGRISWLLGKLIPLAALLSAAAIGFGLLFGWWFRVYQPVFSRSEVSAFPLFAPAAAGWMLVGLTLGMAAGAVLRRSTWAMAATVAGWIGLHRIAPFSGPQPAGRFWRHEFLELGWLLAVALVLTAAAIWSIRLPRRSAVKQARPLAGPADQLTAGPARWRTLARSSGRPGVFMPGLIWRQHRTALLLVLGLLGAGALAVLITGRPMHGQAAGGARQYQSGLLWLPLTLPWLTGAALGAPLVAGEIERGTACFAWTQGVSRGWWISAKLISAGLMLAAGALAFGLFLQWWYAPLAVDRAAGLPSELYPPAFAGWALASFALAACLGAVLRTTVPAAVLTVFIVALAENVLRGFVLAIASGPAVLLRARSSWPLQLAESCGLVAAALLLAGATIWLVRNRSGLPVTGFDRRSLDRRRASGLPWLAVLVPVAVLTGFVSLPFVLVGPIQSAAALISVAVLCLVLVPLIRRSRSGGS